MTTLRIATNRQDRHVNRMVVQPLPLGAAYVASHIDSVEAFSALPLVQSFVGRIRTLTPATIVCGVPAVGLLPQAYFEYLQPDLGLAGDAEETFAQLADPLAAGEGYGDLLPVAVASGGSLVRQKI